MKINVRQITKTGVTVLNYIVQLLTKRIFNQICARVKV